MLRSTSEKKKPSPSAHRDREGGNKSKRPESTSSGEDRPGMAERTSSGLKAAQHLSKASQGGTLRKGFSLWRATSHLKVAAAGAGDLIKRHPAPAALIGGAVTGAAIFFAARSMGASEEQGSDSDEESEGEEESEQDEESGEEEEDDEESDEDDDDQEE